MGGYFWDVISGELSYGLFHPGPFIRDFFLHCTFHLRPFIWDVASGKFSLQHYLWDVSSTMLHLYVKNEIFH